MRPVDHVLRSRAVPDARHPPDRSFIIDIERLGDCRLASVTEGDAACGIYRVTSVFAERTTVTVEVFRDI